MPTKIQTKITPVLIDSFGWLLASAVAAAIWGWGLPIHLAAEERQWAWDHYWFKLLTISLGGAFIGLMVYRVCERRFNLVLHPWWFAAGGLLIFIHFGIYGSFCRVSTMDEAKLLGKIAEAFPPLSLFAGGFTLSLISFLLPRFIPAKWIPTSLKLSHAESPSVPFFSYQRDPATEVVTLVLLGGLVAVGLYYAFG